MRKMGKMKKGLVGLTAAAMLAGSCISGPAFAADATIDNSNNSAKEITFTVNIGDKWTVTVPTEVEATWNDATSRFSVAAENLKARFESLPRFPNGKKLVVYLHDQASGGSPINILTFKEQDKSGDKVGGQEYTLQLKKGASNLTDGKILEILPGATDNLEAGLSGETTENVYKSGTYKAKAAFVIALEDVT